MKDHLGVQYCDVWLYKKNENLNDKAKDMVCDAALESLKIQAQV